MAIFLCIIANGRHEKINLLYDISIMQSNMFLSEPEPLIGITGNTCDYPTISYRNGCCEMGASVLGSKLSMVMVQILT